MISDALWDDFGDDHSVKRLVEKQYFKYVQPAKPESLCYAMWRYWPYYVIMLLTIVQYDVAATLHKLLYDSSFASRYMDFF